MPAPPGLSPKDANQVLRAVMDDTENRLRVDAVISPDGSDLEIHYTDDSIAIGDPASDNILGINEDGSARVSVTNTLVTEPYDYIGITNSTIDGQVVPTIVQYRLGGAGGTLVATLTLTYDGLANITSVTKT